MAVKEKKIIHLHHQVLLLEAAPSDWNEGPIKVLGEFAAPVRKNIEEAGKSYHERCVLLMQEEEDMKIIEVGESSEISQSTQAGKKTKNLFYCDVESVGKADLEDYYALLGIKHLSKIASHEEIRKAYRQVSLVYHPDKNTINDLEKCEKIYKSIQDAYNTLMDEKKRKTYDSSIPFDDSIPDPHDPRDFFELYGPVFARNSIWSVRQPTPPLGDDKSEGKLVDRFYDFWLSFKSWREFPNEEQYDLEEAESRDERRWMDRMNQKIQAQAKREESSRIRTLVEQAMESDPRIQRIRKAKEDERLAKKRAKEEIKRKAMEEEERRKLEKIQAEERRIAQELALKEKAKKDKEVQKKNLKKLRKKIRQMLTEDSAISNEDIQQYTSSLDSDSLQILESKLTGEEIGIEFIISEIQKFRDQPSKSNQNIASIFTEDKKGLEEETRRNRPWSPDELSLLTKAFIRFPGGTPERWEKISESVKGRDPQECMLKAKELKKGPRASAASGQAPEVSVKESEKPAKDVVDQMAALEWSQRQQKQFETALRLVDKNHPDRWGEIAKIVEGKSKKDCIQRFKEIRAKVLASKSAK